MPTSPGVHHTGLTGLTGLTGINGGLSLGMSHTFASLDRHINYISFEYSWLFLFKLLNSGSVDFKMPKYVKSCLRANTPPSTFLDDRIQNHKHELCIINGISIAGGEFNEFIDHDRLNKTNITDN